MHFVNQKNIEQEYLGTIYEACFSSEFCVSMLTL
jgi:hypothetical protein